MPDKKPRCPNDGGSYRRLPSGEFERIPDPAPAAPAPPAAPVADTEED